jgi:hypothetical protein
MSLSASAPKIINGEIDKECETFQPIHRRCSACVRDMLRLRGGDVSMALSLFAGDLLYRECALGGQGTYQGGAALPLTFHTSAQSPVLVIGHGKLAASSCHSTCWLSTRNLSSLHAAAMLCDARTTRADESRNVEHTRNTDILRLKAALPCR